MLADVSPIRAMAENLLNLAQGSKESKIRVKRKMSQQKIDTKFLNLPSAARYIGRSPDWLRDNWNINGFTPHNFAAPGSKKRALFFAKRDLDSWAEERRIQRSDA